MRLRSTELRALIGRRACVLPCVPAGVPFSPVPVLWSRCRSAAEREAGSWLREERRGAGRGLGRSALARAVALRVARGRLAPRPAGPSRAAGAGPREEAPPDGPPISPPEHRAAL